MKQEEDKKLLLKDLCSRLPYRVKVEHLLHAPNNPSDLFAIDVDKNLLYCDHKGREEWYKIDFIKPYLRPMSSMTEEEEITFLNKENHEIYDWLNAHHFDYRWLIEKSLALEAPEGIYKKE